MASVTISASIDEEIARQIYELEDSGNFRNRSHVIEKMIGIGLLSYNKKK